MATDGEQTNHRRRTRGNMGDPIVLRPSKALNRSDVSTHSTDGYLFDEGMTEPPRGNTSVVRLDHSSSSQRTSSSQPITSPIPRRQQTTTRDFPVPDAPTTPTPPRTTRQNLTQPNRKTVSQQLNRPTAGQSARSTSSHPAARSTTSQSTRQTTQPYTTGRQNRQPTLSALPAPNPKTTQKKDDHPPKKIHWLVPAGVGMLAMLALYVLGSSLLSWGTQLYDNYHYGNPRTYQTDYVVGQGGDSPAHPSHFIAMNYNHQAIVIELMAGNPQKAVTYVAPISIAGDDGMAPVTVSFKDVNGDHKPDMIVHVHLPSQDFVSVFINTGTKFRGATSSDKIHM
ncbi:MAG TPA: hypothetical protein VL461_04895 [Dictyobacter sp.]|jgi:hypothetical protein|nr:hypothetical protein [Dictyobacter sp.]